MWRGVASAEITIRSKSALATFGLTADPIAITAKRPSLAAAVLRKSHVHRCALSVGQRRTCGGVLPSSVRLLLPIVGPSFDDIGNSVDVQLDLTGDILSD
jgi:hypothetical protein